MAKVKGPLFSLDARGQIAKTLVYMGWKGLQTVRQYVVPANPNTAGQQTQRGFFGNAITAWQTAGFSAADVTAWNLLAQAQKAVASGFNMFVKYFVNSKVDSDTWITLSNCVISAVDDDSATVTCDIAEDGTTKAYFGTSITSMKTVQALAFAVDECEGILTGLSASTKYYFYVINEKAGDAARLGIYSFTTTAAA